MLLRHKEFEILMETAESIDEVRLVVPESGLGKPLPPQLVGECSSS